MPTDQEKALREIVRRLRANEISENYAYSRIVAHTAREIEALPGGEVMGDLRKKIEAEIERLNALIIGPEDSYLNRISPEMVRVAALRWVLREIEALPQVQNDGSCAVAEPAFQGEGRNDFDQLRRARDHYRQNHPEEVPPPVCPQCGLVGIERIPPTQCRYPACGPGCLYEIGRRS